MAKLCTHCKLNCKHWYRSSEFGTGVSRRPCTRKWYSCTNHHNVLERLSATVLEIAKEHQNGRAEKKSAMADFTERWFRDSGGGTS